MTNKAVRCVLCDEPFASDEAMSCSYCHLYFERGEDGKRRVVNPWPSFGRHDRIALLALRDGLTVAVRDVAYAHYSGSRVLPDHCVKTVMAFLLDLHCQLEGVVLSLGKQVDALERDGLLPKRRTFPFMTPLGG